MTTTHPTATIAAFLTAQLDADEAAARAAIRADAQIAPGVGHSLPHVYEAKWAVREQPNVKEGVASRWFVESERTNDGVAVETIAELYMWWPLGDERKAGAHIARHDPARVLAQVAAMRRIVELHPIYSGSRILQVDSSGTNYGCETCHCIDPIRGEGIIEALGECDTLRALASIYAGADGWREEWAL